MQRITLWVLVGWVCWISDLMLVVLYAAPLGSHMLLVVATYVLLKALVVQDHCMMHDACAGGSSSSICKHVVWQHEMHKPTQLCAYRVLLTAAAHCHR